MESCRFCGAVAACECSMCARACCSTHQASSFTGLKIRVCEQCERKYGNLAKLLKIPEYLRRRFEEWENEGRPAQFASPIEVANWDLSNPRIGEFISRLRVVRCANGVSRAMIDRDVAIEFCERAHESAEGALEAHIVAFMWGYGLAGVGQTRLGWTLKENSNVAQKLFGVRTKLVTEGIMPAFASFVPDGSPFRLKNLGPSFATKDLFFFSGVENRDRALILDKIVVDEFLKPYVGVELDPKKPLDYGKYLFAMYCWAADLGLTPNQTEVLVYGWRLDQLPKESLKNWDPCRGSHVVS